MATVGVKCRVGDGAAGFIDEPTWGKKKMRRGGRVQRTRRREEGVPAYCWCFQSVKNEDEAVTGGAERQNGETAATITRISGFVRMQQRRLLPAPAAAVHYEAFSNPPDLRRHRGKSARRLHSPLEPGTARLEGLRAASGGEFLRSLLRITCSG